MQFPIQLVARSQSSSYIKWLSPVFALVLTVLSGLILFGALGKNPLDALYIFLIAPLETLRGWSEVGIKMTPLLLCAVGLVVCFRANIWNIGAEGQFVMGAVVGGWVALHCPEQGATGYIVLVMLSGMLGGAVWGALVALLRDRFNANEILVSLMLVYVAQLFLAYCVQGPLQDPDGMGYPQSALFQASAMLPMILPGTRLHLGFAIALVASAVFFVLLSRMFIGFQVKVSGMAPKAARYAGFRPSRLMWISMMLSGAMAGLAGVCEVTGPVGQLTLNISPGYGFVAIIVVFVGRLSPIGCIPGAFIMALFYLGGELGQSRLGLPSSITGIYQGLMLFFLLICDVWIVYKPRWIGFVRSAQ